MIKYVLGFFNAIFLPELILARLLIAKVVFGRYYGQKWSPKKISKFDGRKFSRKNIFWENKKMVRSTLGVSEHAKIKIITFGSSIANFENFDFFQKFLSKNR